MSLLLWFLIGVNAGTLYINYKTRKAIFKTYDELIADLKEQYKIIGKYELINEVLKEREETECEK